MVIRLLIRLKTQQVYAHWQDTPVKKWWQPYAPEKAIQSALLKLHSTCAVSQTFLKNWDVDIYRLNSFASFNPRRLRLETFSHVRLFTINGRNFIPSQEKLYIFHKLCVQSFSARFLPDLNNCTQAPFPASTDLHAYLMDFGVEC